MTAAQAPQQSSVTAADGCELRMTRYGHGQEILILVHGFGDHSHTWGELLAQLAAGYSVLALDLRGHGDSQWDPRSEYRIERFVSDLATLLEQLGIDSFSLAGHSLGATIALQIAALLPRKIRRLALVEFNIDPTPEALEATLAQFNEQFRIYGSPEDYHAFLEARRPAADRAALLRYARHAVRPRAAGGYEVKCDPQLRRLYVDFKDPAQSARNRTALLRLSCPLLLVRGQGSAVLTKPAAQQIVNLVPSTQLCVVPGAGHSIMLDRPQEFADLMQCFLLRGNS